MMVSDTVYVFGVLAAAVALFASGRARLDFVALLVLLALLLGNVLTLPAALAGFSDSVVIMIAGLFVVGEALVTTGLAYRVGRWLMRVGGDSEVRLMALLMVAVGLSGAFISSTGIVAIFIPIVLSIAAKTGIARSRLMMPLSIAALISGMMTLIATAPNLIAADALANEGYEPFDFFDFTPIGLAVLIVGVGYMLLVGRRLLPESRSASESNGSGQTIRDMVETFRLPERGHRYRVTADSPLVGQTIAEADPRGRFGLTVSAIERPTAGKVRVHPARPDEEFRTGDIVSVVGDRPAAVEFAASADLTELPSEIEDLTDVVREMGVAKIVVAPNSALIGQTVEAADLQSRHQVDVLALMHDQEPLAGDISDVTLRFGDVLLVSGRWSAIRNLQNRSRDFVVLSMPLELEDMAPAEDRAPWALGILALMVLTMSLELLPNVAAVLMAAIAMIVTRCVSVEGAYRSVNWPTLILIAGMLPLATALNETGGTDLMVDGLVGVFGYFGPMAMMAGLFILTAGLGLFISNTATAVMLAPIAVGVALDMGVSPAPFVMTVAVAASAAFVTPVSSPVNTLVVEPGGYSFTDFAKVGLPLVVLTGLVSLALIPLLFPL